MQFVKMRNHENIPVVIDTNILISYLWGSRNAETIVRMIVDGQIQPVISLPIVEELISVGTRGKFQKRFSSEIFRKFCNAYTDVSAMVSPKKRITVSADIKDNIFLECAVEARVDYLITGDRHLLDVQNFEGIPILAPAEFLKLVK